MNDNSTEKIYEYEKNIHLKERNQYVYIKTCFLSLNF